MLRGEYFGSLVSTIPKVPKPVPSPQEPKGEPVVQATPPTLLPVMSFEERKQTILEKFNLMVERTDQPENFEIRELLEAKGVSQENWPQGRRARLVFLSNQFKGSISRWL